MGMRGEKGSVDSEVSVTTESTYHTQIYCGWSCEMCVHLFWKAVWYQANKITKMSMFFEPKTPLLGLHSKEAIDKKKVLICIKIFIRAVFVIIKNWKQSKCPSLGEWFNKL